MREWAVKRRERTRHLIELGGLVVKAGLVDLIDDDRTTLYGAFLTAAGKLQARDLSLRLLTDAIARSATTGEPSDAMVNQVLDSQ